MRLRGKLKSLFVVDSSTRDCRCPDSFVFCRAYIVPLMFAFIGVWLFGARPDLGGAFVAEVVTLGMLYCAREFIVAVK